MNALIVACSTHTAVESVMFGIPVVGVIGWIKLDSWRRRGEPDPEPLEIEPRARA
jgi:hypothetical protein